MSAANDNSTHAVTLRIAQDHPSLAGHFPGQPVVPGVLLLDRVMEAAEAWFGQALQVKSLPQVKFIAPLLPEQEARLELQRQAEELRFVIRRDDAIIAQGVLNVAAIPAGRR